MSTLQEIRAKLQAQADNLSGNKDNKNSNKDNSIYAFWNVPEGETAIMRFLPDADPTNTFFWVEKAMIKLPFSGVKGQSDKQVVVQVPCMEMWGEVCPVLAEVRTWFKDPNLETMGKKYWKKRTYLFQGLVRKNPMTDDVSPENPIRRLIVSPQVFNLVKASLMDPELEDMPTDFQNGLDFHVTKGTKGGYADYSTSKWSRKTTALTTQEREAIDKYGLFDIKQWLPKKPTDVELKVIKEMFDASVDGQQYDMEKWGQYFKPFGKFEDNKADESLSQDVAAAEKEFSTPVETKAETVKAPAETSTPASGSKADDILALIRSRQQKTA